MLLPPNVGHFHTKKSPSSLRTPAECPLLQFTWETTPSWHQPAGEGPAHRTGPTSPPPTGRGPGHPHFCPTSCRHRVPEPPPHRTRATWDFSAAHQGGQQPEGEQDLGDPHVQKLLSLWILGCNTLPTVGSPTQKPSPFCREVALGRTEKPWPLGSSGGWG